MAFINDDDYSALVRSEIKDMLIEENGSTKLRIAEQMAIDQIKNYLSGRYNVTDIFEKTGDDRNSFLLMITIDCTLYHLYTSINARKMNDIRAQRYQDALDWLKAVGKGQVQADLPRTVTDDGSVDSAIKISSKYPPSNHRW